METVPQEYTYLYDKLLDKEWEFCVPDYEKIYKISCFDDGMDKYDYKFHSIEENKCPIIESLRETL